MPVTVEVPIRLHVDPAAVTDHPDAVIEAFAAAVGRALATSRDVVVAPRGGYVEVLPQAPSLRWTGPDLDTVPRGARLALAGSLSATLDRLVASTGLLDGAAAAGDAPPPLGEPAVEAADPERVDDLFGVYEVPTYEGGVTVLSFEDDVITAGKARPAVVQEWVRLGTGGRTITRALLEQAVGEWHADVPPGAPVGFIARQRRKGAWQWTVIVLGQPRSSFTFADFGEMSFVGEKANPPFRTRFFEPPPAVATAERRSITGASGVPGLLEEWMGPEIRAQFRRVRPKGETMTDGEYDDLLDRAVHREVERRATVLVAALPGGATPTCAVRVRMGSATLTLLGTAEDEKNLHWAGTAHLVPVTSGKAAGAARGKKPGGAKAGGKAAGAGATGTGATGSGASGVGGEGAPGEGAPGEGGPGGAPTGTGGGASAAFVFLPGVAPAGIRAAAAFPSVASLFAQETGCGAFQGEPPLESLGPAGEDLKRLMADIAFRLQMPATCRFAAGFCVQAAAVLAGRGGDISRYISAEERPAFTRPAGAGPANLGPVEFRPVASPAIQFLRHLAGVVPRIRALMERVLALYRSPEHQGKITGTWAGEPVSWALRFWEAMTPALEYAVMWLFLPACQAMLLQLLQASKEGIANRITKFEAYAPIFERLMASQLTDYAELSRLRESLRHHTWAATVQEATGAVGGDVTAAASAANAATAWFAAARGVSGLFLGVEAATQAKGAAGEIVTDKGVARIRDSHGLLWTLADLEQAMVMQRGLAEGIDPLVKQMADVPDVMERFRRSPTAIRDELWRVLHEMQANNTEMLGKARRDVWFAFSASRISEHIPSATVSGSRYALQGIHLQAHEQLGEFFLGDRYYAQGIDLLFGSEEGRRALSGFFLTVGIVGLSILCPPAGFVVGVGVAAYEVGKAKEKERLYGALIDPELVLTRAEVEVELFAAYLGFALSLIPEAGTAVKAVARGGKVALRAGVGAGARAAGRYVVRRATKQIIEAASKDLLERFVVELTTNLVMERVIEQVMAPILAHLEREAQIRSAVGGPAGAQVILAILGEERAKAAR